jgi:hypothetical protein
MAADAALATKSDQVRLRASRSHVVAWSVIAFLPLCARLVPLLVMRPGSADAPLWLDIVWWLADSFLFVTLPGRLAATLTPAGIEMRRLRRVVIAWPDLAAIRVEPFLLSRRVMLCERDGRRTSMPVPTTSWLLRDPEFDDKVARIRECWARYSAGQTRTPEPVAVSDRYRLSERLRLRPAATWQLLVGSACAPVALAGGLLVATAGAYDPDLGPDLHTLGLVLLAVTLPAFWFLAVSPGITLTPDTLIVHGPRRREIAWHDVQSITSRHRLGGIRLTVREASGRRTELPSPRASVLFGDADFGAKALAVRTYWHGRRLPLSPWSPDGRWQDDLSEAAFLGRQQTWQQTMHAAAICTVLVVTVILLGLLVLAAVFA